MPSKCSAFGCRSGYDGWPKRKGEPDGEEPADKITFHRCPLADKDLLEKWIRANPRDNWTPTINSRICSLHFLPGDFKWETTDSNRSRRRKKYLTEKLLRRSIKPGAVPSVFANIPEYLTSMRAEAASKDPTVPNDVYVRLRKWVNSGYSRKVVKESLVVDDDISCLMLSDIKKKLEEETTITEDFVISIVDQSLLVYILQLNLGIPTVKTCVTIQEDRRVVVSLNGELIPSSEYRDFVDGQICYMSEIINLVSLVKEWTTEQCSEV